MKTVLIRWSRAAHKALFWLALFALFAFVLSALTHPIMVWTGPQSVQFRPPVMQLKAQQVKLIPEIIKHSGVEQSFVTKVIPTEDGPMLQISPEENGPRLYFPLSEKNPDSMTVLKNYDEAQATWLARYYTGEKSDIRRVSLITEFSSEYPWVNRLLPVYKVEFDSKDNLSAYIYTETNSLAGLNNSWKQTLQAVFQMFHTWSWLDDFPVLRVFLVSILLLSLLSMLCSGVVMLLYLKRKQTMSISQLWHRKIAWIVFLPLLGFTVSGIYHLYQYQYGENHRGMRLGKVLNLDQFDKVIDYEFEKLEGLSLNGFSLVEHKGEYLFRASVAASGNPASHKPHDHGASRERSVRNQRFDGVSTEKTAFYFSLLDGKESQVTDSEVAKALALDYLAFYPDSPEAVISEERITRFGPEYDFRNKRLPVWKFELDTALGDRLFVDPITGILVDRLVDKQRYEGYSFSFLHKWNFMLAFTSREKRDIGIVLMLGFTALLGLLGIFSRRRG